MKWVCGIKLMVILSLISVTTSGESNRWIMQLVGSYDGRVVNEGFLEPICTTLYLNDEGILCGKYEVKEAKGILKGKLTFIALLNDRSIQMKWEDVYGSGLVILKFSTNALSFNGWWGNGSEQPEYTWTGTKRVPI